MAPFGDRAPGVECRTRSRPPRGPAPARRRAGPRWARSAHRRASPGIGQSSAAGTAVAGRLGSGHGDLVRLDRARRGWRRTRPRHRPRSERATAVPRCGAPLTERARRSPGRRARRELRRTGPSSRAHGPSAGCARRGNGQLTPLFRLDIGVEHTNAQFAGVIALGGRHEGRHERLADLDRHVDRCRLRRTAPRRRRSSGRPPAGCRA